MALDLRAGQAYVRENGRVHYRALPPGINPNSYPNESPMGSTPSGSAKPTIGHVLPLNLEIDRDGGSRASASGRS